MAAQSRQAMDRQYAWDDKGVRGSQRHAAGATKQDSVRTRGVRGANFESN